MTSWAGWRIDAWVKCPRCGGGNDGAALFGDVYDDSEGPLGIYDGIESVPEEPCFGCGARLRIRIEVVEEVPR